MKHGLTVLWIAAALAVFIAGPVLAAWPEKPVKIIVPFKPGGSSDQTARIFQKAIEDNDLMPQKLTVVNVGEHYTIGSRQAMEAKPDGYTFLLIHKALMGAQGGGMIDFGHADFEPVAETSEFCLMPVVREDDQRFPDVQSLMKDSNRQPRQPDFRLQSRCAEPYGRDSIGKHDTGRQIPFCPDRRRHGQLYRSYRQAD